MRANKRIIGLFAVILLVAVIFAIYGGDYVQSKKALNNFSKLVDNGKVGDLNLTIYYMKPWFTLIPTSIDMLINGCYDYKIIISGSNLDEHIDLLKQMGNAALIPVIHSSRIDACLYYIFETEEEGKIFDVAMWGDNYSIYVNGLEVKSNDIFYDIVMPFLSDDLAANLEVNKKDAKRIKLE